MRENYISLLSSTQRPGIWQLITYLEKETDFFTAPASTRYHVVYEGGLIEHCLNVYECFKVDRKQKYYK
jgi:23S rRNA maturation-related 3'-5' exoribonuclease YhaM